MWCLFLPNLPSAIACRFASACSCVSFPDSTAACNFAPISSAVGLFMWCLFLPNLPSAMACRFASACSCVSFPDSTAACNFAPISSGKDFEVPCSAKTIPVIESKETAASIITNPIRFFIMNSFLFRGLYLT